MKRTRVQAVILIHGMGEQMPLQTLREFVGSVWVENKAMYPGDPGRLWNRPSPDGNITQTRLVAHRGASETRTEFFEFYWAHLMTETKLAHVLSWARVLLL